MTALPLPRQPGLLLFVFALSLFVSAALLFNVQPMIGKMLLPKVGGAPAVWNVAMAFFQIALLLGYLLAHLLTRLPALAHGLIYLAILASALFTLPISLPENALTGTSDFPPLLIMLVLVQSVALPFIALAISAPTLQRLFSQSGHPAAHDPYFLYAASNLGSFVGLLAYPFIIEPQLNLTEQTHLWQSVYTAFGVMAIACLFYVRHGAVQVSETIATPAPDWPTRLKWIALAAIPSSLTLGATTHITTDVAAMPLIWAVILALYLLTFVLAFHPPRWLNRRWLYEIHPWLIMIALAAKLPSGTFGGASVILNALMDMMPHLLAFTAAVLVCHIRLSDARPPAKHLTEYYLWLSVGGAIGGALTAFVLPFIFARASEYPLALLLTLAINPRRDMGESAAHIKTILIIVFALSIASLNAISQQAGLYWPMMAILVTLIFGLGLWRRHIVIMGACLIALFTLFIGAGDMKFIGRNFFGVTRVADVQSTSVPDRVIRQIQHGTTRHGRQIIAPEPVNEPNSYYYRAGPLGAILGDPRFLTVAVVGLGAGNMNCYQQAGRSFHFIEIDSLVIDVARNYFTFLKDCGEPTITLGDGRLVLAHDTTTYDMIVLDAFSSDFIPVHLLTREALQLYISRLKPDGVLMLHISNRYFDLRGMLTESARTLGLSALFSRTEPAADKMELDDATSWMAMARDPQALAPYININSWNWSVAAPDMRPWTDDYSNMVDVMKSSSPKGTHN